MVIWIVYNAFLSRTRYHLFLPFDSDPKAILSAANHPGYRLVIQTADTEQQDT